MKFLFQFSGEHPELPKAELLAVLEGECMRWRRIYENKKSRILILEVKTEKKKFVQRLGMTKLAAEIIAEGDDLASLSPKIFKKIKNCKSFKVKCKSKKIENELGGLLHERGLKVNLDNPEKTVFCFLTKKKIFACIRIPLERNFEERKPQFRPYFHPTSMHPKIARVLVNLARVRNGDVVLDPFCGTGGILIEAGLVGCKIVGQDISREMVEGCKKNIKFYGLKGKIRKGDALKEKLPEADAVVTDPPYGRSSYSSDDVLLLYNNFIKKSYESVKKNGFMVVVVPNDIKPKLGNFKLVEKFDLRVHKSLTRRILVLRRC